jgi:hypothetical protein
MNAFCSGIFSNKFNFNSFIVQRWIFGLHLYWKWRNVLDKNECWKESVGNTSICWQVA